MIVWEQAAEASPAALSPHPASAKGAHGAEGLSAQHREPAPAPRKTWHFRGEGAAVNCGRLWHGREHGWQRIPSAPLPVACRELSPAVLSPVLASTRLWLAGAEDAGASAARPAAWREC